MTKRIFCSILAVVTVMLLLSMSAVPGGRYSE